MPVVERVVGCCARCGEPVVLTIDTRSRAWAASARSARCPCDRSSIPGEFFDVNQRMGPPPGAVVSVAGPSPIDPQG